MLFYEPLFLFLFGPAVYLLYLFFGEVRARRAVILLAASVAFYAWSEPVFIFLVFASVGLDLYVAQKIAALSIGDPTVIPDASHKRSDRESRLASEAVIALDFRSGLRPAGNDTRKLWLALGVVGNLAILVYYKYTGFLGAQSRCAAQGADAAGDQHPADRFADRRLLHRLRKDHLSRRRLSRRHGAGAQSARFTGFTSFSFPSCSPARSSNITTSRASSRRCRTPTSTTLSWAFRASCSAS